MIYDEKIDFAISNNYSYLILPSANMAHHPELTDYALVMFIADKESRLDAQHQRENKQPTPTETIMLVIKFVNGNTRTYKVQSDMIVNDFVNTFTKDYPEYFLGVPRTRERVKSQKTFSQEGYQPCETLMAFPNNREIKEMMYDSQ